MDAQFEIVTAIGTSHFLGDLGGKPLKGTNDISDLNFQTTRYALLGGFRVFLGDKVAFRTNIAYARVTGDDRFTHNKERRGRNANFFSPILEGSALFEFHIGHNGRSRYDKSGSFYFYSGIGYFYYEPKGRLNGEVLSLRPLGTEGQNYRTDLKPYRNTSVNIPFGFGYRFRVGDGYLGLEINSRANFTDYIDDVSTVFPDRSKLFATSGAKALEWVSNTNSDIPGFDDPGAIRGDPKDMDGFFFILIKFDYPLHSAMDLGFGSGKRGRGGFRFKKGHCWEF
ncbi:MAG: hypothetical protein J5I91_06965 [Bacteroidetes bacterium]|nr:hypothetical protein [Bacteroidota bacterium]